MRVCKRLGGIFDYDLKAERLVEVARELEAPDVWRDPQRAQALGRERAQLEKVVGTVDEVSHGLADAKDLLDMAVEEEDEAVVESVAAEHPAKPTPTIAFSIFKRAQAEPKRRIGPKCC